MTLLCSEGQKNVLSIQREIYVRNISSPLEDPGSGSAFGATVPNRPVEDDSPSPDIFFSSSAFRSSLSSVSSPELTCVNSNFCSNNKIQNPKNVR